MVKKSDILNNLRDYPPDEVAEAIKAGVVTMYELSKSGNLTPLMRRRIEESLASRPVETTQPSPDVLSVDVDDDSSEDSEIHSTTVDGDISDLDSESLNQETSPSQSTSEKSNKGMFKRPFSFKGRIRRTEYCLSFVIYMVWSGIIRVMSGSSPDDISVGASFFVLITFTPMIWFLWAQSAKRCHDRGHSGWFQLIPFYYFVLLFGGGEVGSNEYGDNPKE